MVRTVSLKKRRQGAVAVEFAVIAPLFFLLIFGIIEAGRMLMVQEVLINSAREGARRAALPGTTETEVNQSLDNYLTSAGIAGYTKQVSPSLATVTSGTTVSVTVTVPFDNVSWLPARWFGDLNLRATVLMRKE